MRGEERKIKRVRGRGRAYLILNNIKGLRSVLSSKIYGP
jgi:hypothetical protein